VISLPFRPLALGLALSLAPLMPQAPAARAQSSADAPFAKTRAANLARMYAENLNGGLSAYRAGACMYRTGGEGCLVRADAEGFTFRFPGGSPGWEQQTPPAPTWDSVITISADGRSVIGVPYNGPTADTSPQPGNAEEP